MSKLKVGDIIDMSNSTVKQTAARVILIEDGYCKYTYIFSDKFPNLIGATFRNRVSVMECFPLVNEKDAELLIMLYGD